MRQAAFPISPSLMTNFSRFEQLDQRHLMLNNSIKSIDSILLINKSIKSIDSILDILTECVVVLSTALLYY